MKENLKSALWIAVATCVGVLLAKIISNTGVIEKIVPDKNQSGTFEALDDDEPVLYF